MFGCASTNTTSSVSHQGTDKPPVVERAKELSPEHSALYKQAVALLKSGDLSAAETGFRKLSEILKDSPGVLTNLGIIAELNGDDSAASAFYQEALSINGSYVAALNNLGNLHMKQGQFKQAKTLYEKGLKGDPTNTDTLLNIAILNELYLHDLPSALTYYQQYQELVTPADEVIAGRIVDIKRRIN